jgi:4-nitrophenyl phosphatase
MKTLLLDLDGTMYRGTAAIQAGIDLINRLHQANVPYLFLTNNAMRTHRENADHMLAMGYKHIEPEQFFTSAMAAAMYAKEHYDQNRAFMIGAKGLEQALLEQGFEITEDDADFVFVGLDKKADYARYSKAIPLLMSGAVLIGTNPDRVLAKPDGFEMGNGSIVAMFEYAGNQSSPKIGKPHSPILEYCLKNYGLSKEDVVIVGDNLETDIALGCNEGVETIFVQSGVHHASDIEKLNIHPDHVIRSLDEIVLDEKSGWKVAKEV